MSEPDRPKAFHTLRGANRGEEPDEPILFAYKAALRIHGDNLPFDEISRQLGVEATHKAGCASAAQYRDKVAAEMTSDQVDKAKGRSAAFVPRRLEHEGTTHK